MFIKFEEQIKQMPYTSIKLINVHKVLKILKILKHFDMEFLLLIPLLSVICYLY